MNGRMPSGIPEEKVLVTSYQMFVGGEFVDARSGRTMEAVDPYRGEAFAIVPDADAQDVEDAAAAAQIGFQAWSALPGIERATMLHKLGDLMIARADELGGLESRDNGKLLRETTGQA